MFGSVILAKSSAASSEREDDCYRSPLALQSDDSGSWVLLPRRVMRSAGYAVRDEDCRCTGV